MDKIFSYIQDIHNTLDYLPIHDIRDVINILNEARLRRRQIFIMGNGGSASTASHFVCDLGKNARVKNRPHFRVIGLTDNVASITAYANDEGYENIFSQQLIGLLQYGDVVIAISGSGNSRNVLKAIEVANDCGAMTIGFTGFDGGQLGKIVKKNINVAGTCIEQVEDIHLMIEHMIITALKDAAQPIPVQNSIDLMLAEDISTISNVSIVDAPEVDHKLVTEPIRIALELLYNSNRESMSPAEMYNLLTHVLQGLVMSASATSGSLLILDSEGDVKDGVLAYGGTIQARPAQQLGDILNKGLAGWVVRNNKPALVPSTRDDPRWLSRSWEEDNGSSRSAISVPLMDQSKVIGVLTLVRPHNQQFTGEDLTQLTALAVLFSLKDYVD